MGNKPSNTGTSRLLYTQRMTKFGEIVGGEGGAVIWCNSRHGFLRRTPTPPLWTARRCMPPTHMKEKGLFRAKPEIVNVPLVIVDSLPPTHGFMSSGALT